jgi:DNA ligase (NAD+)
VTSNVLQIASIPKTICTWISDDKVPEYVEVRGEVFLYNSDFEKINEERLALGLDVYSTARNAASGNLRRLDNQTDFIKNLNFFAYNLQFSTGESKRSQLLSLDQSKALQFLEKINFKVANFDRNLRSVSMQPCINLMNDYSNFNGSKIEKQRKKQAFDLEKDLLVQAMFSLCDIPLFNRTKLGYSVDGVVVKIDSVELQNLVGLSVRTPKWAVAYKFPAEEGYTTLLDIKIQVGRTGVLTPVAVLEPLTLGGVLIERATLHNQDEVNRLRLSRGKRVRVIRSGDVIPKILGCAETNMGSVDTFSLPSFCPVCGGATAKEILESRGEQATESVVIRCTNGISCTAQAIEGIKHFVSRDGVDIKGLGNVTVEELYTEGFIQSIADIYRLEQKNRERAPELRLV